MFNDVSIAGFGQNSIIVKDSNERSLGSYFKYLDVGNSAGLTVLLTGSILVRLNIRNGVVAEGLYQFYFESTDCSGQALMHASDLELLAPTILAVHNDIKPRPLLLAQPWPTAETKKEIEPKSSYDNGICWPETIPVPLELVALENMIISDPSTYGFEIVESREGNQWGFPPPLSISLSKSDMISCNGFESCPTQ